MEIEPEYEIKFHVYDGNEQDINQLRQEYLELKDDQREEGSVMSRVNSYFFEGLVELLDADISFWEENYTKAFEKYNNAERMFTRFKNSRNVEVRIDLLAQRLINRVIGLRSCSEAIQIQDPSIKREKFNEALNYFNEEVTLSNNMEETMSSYAAFARASFAEAQLLRVTANSYDMDMSGEAKKMLMQSRSAIRQAAFIDPRFIDFMYDIEDNLDDLTKNRILVKAEKFGDDATIKSEDGNYKEAIEDFRRASMFYKRASELASDTSSRRYLLSSATIYEASELEAEGNHLFRRLNETLDASEKFDEAATQVDKAIALMGRFGSDELVNSFAAQRDYYKAMGLQSKAISLFDNDQFVEAKELFKSSMEQFDNAISVAKEGDNDVIVSMSEEAKADIKGYISMCDAMS